MKLLILLLPLLLFSCASTHTSYYMPDRDMRRVGPLRPVIRHFAPDDTPSGLGFWADGRNTGMEYVWRWK